VNDDIYIELNKRDLRRLVRRLIRQGKSSEEIKMWFVEHIPQALHDVAVDQPKAGFKKS